MRLLSTFNSRPASRSFDSKGRALRLRLDEQARLSTRNKGFTLIEILVVVAIIGVLAGVVILMLDNAQAKSRDARRIADMSSLKTALMMYKEANGVYFSGATVYGGGGCRVIKADTSLNSLVTSGYISALPQDPMYDSTAPCAAAGSHNYRWYFADDNSYCPFGICQGDLVLYRFVLESPVTDYKNIDPWHLPATNLGFGACAKPEEVIAAGSSTVYDLDLTYHEYCQILKK
jgi:prepilin-type N-terminal cleavage/methylation domain-containing protein